MRKKLTWDKVRSLAIEEERAISKELFQRPFGPCRECCHTITFNYHQLKELIEPSEYEVPLPQLVTTDGEQQYLTLKNGKYFASRKSMVLKQSFTRKELEMVPEIYRKLAIKIN